MANSRQPIERVPTGIPGLDTLLEGGFLRGGCYIVQGSPGAGKTLLGNQASYNHASAGGSVVYVTLLAESHARMLAHLGRMAFFEPTLIPERVYYVSGFKVLESEGLGGLLTTLRQAITARRATLLVLDGLVSAEEEAANDRDFKKFIHELQTVTGMTGCTALLLSSTGRSASLPPELTMVDGVIDLAEEVVRLRTSRRLRVLKLRGASPVRGYHTFDITDAGLHVHPRIETVRRTQDEAARPSERLPVGVAGMDALLGGGLPAHSMTMLLGPSGCGKTTLGLQFLGEGVRRGEKGLLFGFFERSATLARKAEMLGIDLAAAHARGLYELVWQRGVEAEIDVLAHRLLDAVERHRPTRLFLDGVQGFVLAAEYPERVREVFAVLAEELDARGVTTVYSMESQQLAGTALDIPVVGLSAVTQNLLLLRHVEVGSELRRLFSVAKLREGRVDGAIRELVIGPQGLEIGDRFHGFEGVLTGLATRSPAAATRTKAGSRGTKKTGGRGTSTQARGGKRGTTPRPPRRR